MAARLMRVLGDSLANSEERKFLYSNTEALSSVSVLHFSYA